MSATQWLENSSRERKLPASVLSGTTAPISDAVESKPWKASWNKPAPRKTAPSRPAVRQPEPELSPVTITPENAESVKRGLQSSAIRTAWQKYIEADHTPQSLKYKVGSTELSSWVFHSPQKIADDQFVAPMKHSFGAMLYCN